MSSTGAAHVLLGRDAELAALVRAVTSPPAHVAVVGEPDAGKTRLLAELPRHRLLADRTVLSARCEPLRKPLPLGPVLEAVAKAPLAPVADRLSPVAGVLRAVLPELIPVLPAPPQPLGAELTRHQIFRALREVLVACGRTVLVLDDAEHADEDTLDFLRFLTGAQPQELAVVTSSVEETPHGAPVRIALRPWTRADVERFARTALGTAALPPGFAEDLCDRTGGLPGVVRELLRRGSPADASVAELALPPRVRASVRDRMARLGPAGAEVLAVAAVLGEPAREHAIAALSRLPEDTASAAVEDAVRAVLLVETAGRYRVRHPLAAQAILESIPGTRCRRLHARAAAFLATEGQPPARVAKHYREAFEIGNWTQWTGTAVDRAAGEDDVDEVVRLLEEALDDPELPAAARERFAVRLSHEMHHGLVRAATLTRLRAIVHERALSKGARGEIRMNLGRAMVTQSGEIDAGRHEIELAAADLTQRSAVLARGLMTLAMPHVGAVPLKVNLRWLERAELASKGVADVELMAAAMANRVSTRMQVADPGVWSVIDALPRAPASPEVRRQLGRTYINLADAAVWNGHHAVAQSYLDTARRLISGDRQPYLDALAAGTELRLNVMTGRWSRVAEDARLLIGRVGEASSLAAEPLLALGWLDLEQARPTAALRNFENAFALSTGTVPLQASAFAGRAAVHLAAHDAAAARTVAGYGIDALRAKGNWVWAAELMPFATRALLETGDTECARSTLAEYEQGVSGRDAPLAKAAATVCRGLIARADGELATAADLLRRAGESYRALPHPYFAASADERAAECFAELGDHQSAIDLMTAAEAAFGGLTASADALRCRRVLRRFDTTLPRRGRKGYGEALSPRELEVARLAARNLTNREIAEQLFLSPRTVEIHIGKALRKLGLPSRKVLSEALERSSLTG
ncbi:ATP-binding protein [Amycolatopsis minnesotensis]|uniref:LuxR family transcriptional regulator n=1 Tax=Amycolatopsis minnesotensis TaxID=337894 RepID=A0ABN2SWD2_9PSEU